MYISLHAKRSVNKTAFRVAEVAFLICVSADQVKESFSSSVAQLQPRGKPGPPPVSWQGLAGSS